MNFTQILTNDHRFKEFFTNMLSLNLGANLLENLFIIFHFSSIYFFYS